MGLIHRKPPSASEVHDFRARERFDQETHDALRLVGSVTVDMGSISAGAITTFTITVNGALADEQNAVCLAPPSAIESGLVWCGFVSADDTVTVRVHNTTGSPVNPAEGVWGCRVFP
jgi:hypothetical protein